MPLFYPSPPSKQPPATEPNANSPSDSTPPDASSRKPIGLTQGPGLVRSSPDRLGMTLDQRILIGGASAFFCGFVLGSSHAGHMAGLRFRAENAHRLPISQPGWYLYQKSKNYYKMRAGITNGIRKGTYLATWGSIFFIVEESMDVFRGTWRAGRTIGEMEGVDELDIGDMHSSVEFSRDFFSSTMAGMVMGGLWSVWNHFPAVTAARTMRLGMFAGAGYGLFQDGMTWVRNSGVERVGKEFGWFYRKKEGKNGKVDEEAQQKP